MDLFEALKERQTAIKDVERQLRDAQFDVSGQLSKAEVSVHSGEATKNTIHRWTESLKRYQFYRPVVAETPLEATSLNVAIESHRDFKETLLTQPAVSIDVDRGQLKTWNELAGRYAELGLKRNQVMMEARDTASPVDPTEKKRARRETASPMELDVQPLIVSQLGPSVTTGSTVTGTVVHNEPDSHFYIQLEGGSSQAALELLQTKIQRHMNKPVPQLDKLVRVSNLLFRI